MGQPGDLAPCGIWQCGGAPSKAENVYRTLRAQVTDPKTGQPAFDLTEGTYQEARYYAQALQIAAWLVAIERAEAQGDVGQAVEGLPNLEKDYGLTPAYGDSVRARQAVLTAKKRSAKGARFDVAVQVLRTLLGANFLSYSQPTVRTLFPADPASSIQVNAKPLNVVPKFLALVDPIAGVNPADTRWVRYANLDPTQVDATLAAGDVVMVQAENTGCSERVTVLAVRGSGATRDFQAVFANAHDAGATVTTMHYPWQLSSLSTVYVVVKNAVAADARTRAKIFAALNDITRGVVNFAVLREDCNTVPFTLGTSPLGTHALLVQAYTLSP